jgi:uncharacterized protein YacL
MGIYIFRVLILSLLVLGGYFFPPFGLSAYAGGLIALFFGFVIFLLEAQIRKSQFKIFWGALIGIVVGVMSGWALSAIYKGLAPDSETTSFFRILFLLLMPYIGYLVGSRNYEWFEPAHLTRFFKGKSVGRSFKILDTSVIIDGRISDICDSAFIEGTLVIPQFILKELQLVADSSDGIKRQRGRRGLDVLDHLQKSSQVNVIISEVDFAGIKDVDSKLIELAKHLDAKIITNDFNLSKISQLQGIPVLNINELANALRPVVLPGETLKVFILKEGKEKDQGVAYLDDGTMVVVDNSRKMIGQTIDVTVTSVLQTTVGKMIFGRYNEG